MADRLLPDIGIVTDQAQIGQQRRHGRPLESDGLCTSADRRRLECRRPEDRNLHTIESGGFQRGSRSRCAGVKSADQMYVLTPNFMRVLPGTCDGRPSVFARPVEFGRRRQGAAAAPCFRVSPASRQHAHSITCASGLRAVSSDGAPTRPVSSIDQYPGLGVSPLADRQVAAWRRAAR